MKKHIAGPHELSKTRGGLQLLKKSHFPTHGTTGKVLDPLAVMKHWNVKYMQNINHDGNSKYNSVKIKFSKT